jgi:hypothetical protein
MGDKAADAIVPIAPVGNSLGLVIGILAGGRRKTSLKLAKREP